jgi:hypothetical protein
VIIVFVYFAQSFTPPTKDIAESRASLLEFIDNSGNLREGLNFSYVLGSREPGNESLDTYSRTC